MFEKKVAEVTAVEVVETKEELKEIEQLDSEKLTLKNQMEKRKDKNFSWQKRKLLKK